MFYLLKKVFRYFLLKICAKHFVIKLSCSTRNIIFDWMEHYRIAVGITSPLRVTSKPHCRSLSRSASSDPGNLRQIGAGRGKSVTFRSPSAPANQRNKVLSKSVDPAVSHSSNQLQSSTEMNDPWKLDAFNVKTDVPSADQLARAQPGKVVSAASG